MLSTLARRSAAGLASCVKARVPVVAVRSMSSEVVESDAEFDARYVAYFNRWDLLIFRFIPYIHLLLFLEVELLFKYL